VVVKEKVGRRRYIIVENSHGWGEIFKEIKRIDERAKVIMKDDYIVLRCRHWYKDEIIEILNSRGFRTFTTTGTIRRAKEEIQRLRTLYRK